jgi:hypothetical protein
MRLMGRRERPINVRAGLNSAHALFVHAFRGAYISTTIVNSIGPGPVEWQKRNPVPEPDEPVRTGPGLGLIPA